MIPSSPLPYCAALFLFIALSACDPALDNAAHTVSADTDASQELFAPDTPSPLMTIGTHDLGSTEPEDFVEVQPDQTLPVVYGPQGSYMIILALRVDHWQKSEATIVVRLVDGEDVVASLYYPDNALDLISDNAYLAFNLFVITNDWENYVGVPLLLEVSLINELEEPLAAVSMNIQLDSP